MAPLFDARFTAPTTPDRPADVHVVMPVWRPDPRFLAEQIASLAAQTLPPECVHFVIADGSSAAIVRNLTDAAGLPHRLVEPGADLDAPRAVQAGLAAALAVAGPGAVFALADQDDVWLPGRLAQGVAALAAGGAALVHSDATVIGADGAPLAPSMFAVERRHRRPGLRGLLLRNNVTGMTATFTRALAERSLPFPAQDGVHFYHDLWLALLAAATEGVGLIEAPLVAYRQHGGNVMGTVDRRRIPLPRAVVLRAEAAAYGLARYLAHAVAARIGALEAAGSLTARPGWQRALAPYLSDGGLRGAARLGADALRLAATGHLRLARIAGGHAGVHLGRSVWAVADALGPGLAASRARFDERLYGLAPGVPPPETAAAAAVPRAARPAAEITDARMRPAFGTTPAAGPPRLHVLVPTLNPTEIFAGVATAVDLGLRLAAAGQAVTFVATDSPVLSPPASAAAIRRRLPAGLTADFALHCGRNMGALPVTPADRFLATAWWSAHVATSLARTAGIAPRFVYLIQDHEPHFYPWGAEFAAAEASYGLDFLPVFNSEPLRAHFAALGHGFAAPGALVFRPAIDVARHASVLRRPLAGGARRLAVYGRPAVPRNLFPTAVEALQGFLSARGLRPGEVELASVGLRHAAVDLGGGHRLESLGKLPIGDYPAWLAGADLGLALMHSPHPGHVAIEMAASGVRTVTNRFGARDLGALTPAILTAPPEAPALAAALSRAWDMPPVTAAERQVDLTPLGPPLDQVAQALAARLRDGAV